VGLDGQRLDLPSEKFDCALSTFTLCTIPDPRAALSELLRVLQTDGAFHFLEHGRSPDPKVATWQNRLQPINGRIAGGCHLNRDIAALITAAGFVIEDLRNYYGKSGPKAFEYISAGVARKVPAS